MFFHVQAPGKCSVARKRVSILWLSRKISGRGAIFDFFARHASLVRQSWLDLKELNFVFILYSLAERHRLFSALLFLPQSTGTKRKFPQLEKRRRLRLAASRPVGQGKTYPLSRHVPPESRMLHDSGGTSSQAYTLDSPSAIMAFPAHSFSKAAPMFNTSLYQGAGRKKKGNPFPRITDYPL